MDCCSRKLATQTSTNVILQIQSNLSFVIISHKMKANVTVFINVAMKKAFITAMRKEYEESFHNNNEERI